MSLNDTIVARPPNRAERVLALLQAASPKWVESWQLEKPGGRCAWRTAVSEARALAKIHGGEIDNRTRRVYMPSRGEYRILSEYRYTPAALENDVPTSSGHNVNVGFTLEG